MYLSVPVFDIGDVLHHFHHVKLTKRLKGLAVDTGSQYYSGLSRAKHKTRGIDLTLRILSEYRGRPTPLERGSSSLCHIYSLLSARNRVAVQVQEGRTCCLEPLWVLRSFLLLQDVGTYWRLQVFGFVSVMEVRSRQTSVAKSSVAPGRRDSERRDIFDLPAVFEWP
jgi:hypothetical protein